MRHTKLVAGILAAGTAGIALAYLHRGQAQALPEGLIQVNGRIEGDLVTISSKYPGRITRLFAREGDTVTRGQLVVQVDDAQTRAQRDQAAADLRAAIAQEQGAGVGVTLTANTTSAQTLQAQGLVNQAQSAIAGATSDSMRACAAVTAAAAAARSATATIGAAQATVEAARADKQKSVAGLDSAQAQMETSAADLRAAQASVDAASAVYERTARDAQRYTALLAQNAVSRQTTDQAGAAAQEAKAQLEGARRQVDAAQAQVAARQAEVESAKQQIAAADAAIAQAKAQLKAAQEQTAASHAAVGQAVAEWRSAQQMVRQAEARKQQALGQLEQAQTAPQQVAVSRSSYSQAQARIRQAQAALNEIESTLQDLSITTPVSGVITTRYQDVGEVVLAGSPLLEVVDLDRLYLKVYVPENQIGKLRLGLPARIYTDAFPHKPFSATVGYIASQAEFTPKEVQTTTDRVKLVYAVKLYLDQNPDHRLTPGIPADAVIRWKEKSPWAEPQW